MKATKPNSFLISKSLSLITFLVLATCPAPGQTVWTGPSISYSQPSPDPTQPANQDRITAIVWITRGTTDGIFNAYSESSFAHFFSPADTEWSDGDAANYQNLTFTDWNTWAKNIHSGPPSTVGIPAVVHLITDNIYLDITFTSWGGNGGGFSYTRATPSVVNPTPSVTITNPADGTVLAAPANVNIAASATVSSGSVTNVGFFTNGAPLGAVAMSPFTLTAINLPAGAYTLTAVATAAGISATSAVVNVSVVNPAPLILSSAAEHTGNFNFAYSANTGLSYVVQSSSNLLTWVSLVTNVATSSSVTFTNSAAARAQFYRVTRLPNP